MGVDDIGAEVGVTGPAIYRHFRGKDAVLLGVLERATATLAGALDDALASAGPDGQGGAIERLVRGAVGLVLDQPALTAAYLRERGRLTREEAAPLLAGERRIRQLWLAAMRDARPELDDVRSVIRTQAVVGALTTGALRHPGVERPRLDDLLVASSVAVMRAPAIDAEVVPASTTWSAPPSKRDEILRAALRLMRSRGVSGVGIDEIGAAAGISGPTVYHYFPSKAAIVLDAFDRAGEQVAGVVEAAIHGAPSAEAALDRLVRSYVAIAADNVDLIVVTSRAAEALSEADRPRLARRRQLIFDGWIAALQAVRPDLADAEARLLVRCVFPLVNHAVEAAEGHGALEPEIAALASAHLSQEVNQRLTRR